MLTSLRAALPKGRSVPWFAGATFANSLGMGIYYPFSLLFFQSVLDTSLTRIGLALTPSALLVLPLLPYVGRLIDRIGPRRVLFASTAVRAAAFAGYLWVDSFALFAVLSVLVALSMRAEQTATLSSRRCSRAMNRRAAGWPCPGPCSMPGSGSARWPSG